MNYVVCGPPGSGKTSYVMRNRSQGDLIVDVDAIYHAITGLPVYEKPDALFNVVMGTRDYLVSCIRASGNSWYNSWIIAGGARARDRYLLADRVCAQVVVLEIGWSDCVRRIQQDAKRPDYVKRTYPSLIEKWWKDYERDPRDIVITLKDQTAEARGSKSL